MQLPYVVLQVKNENDQRRKVLQQYLADITGVHPPSIRGLYGSET